MPYIRQSDMVFIQALINEMTIQKIKYCLSQIEAEKKLEKKTEIESHKGLYNLQNKKTENSYRNNSKYTSENISNGFRGGKRNDRDRNTFSFIQRWAT